MNIKIWERLAGPIGFILRVFAKCGRDKVSAYSAQTAFFVLMSLFPFLMLLLQLMRYVPVSQESLLLAVDSIFPEYLLPTIHEILQEIYSSSLSLVAVSSLTTLWASSKAIHALQEGLGTICNENKTKSWFVVRAWALLYTFLVAIILIICVALIVVWQRLRNFIIHYRPQGLPLYIYSTILQAFFTIVVLTLAFAVMYRVFPHKKSRFVDQLPGALIASIGWYGFSSFVTFYISAFHGFSMYGSLTTLTLAMFWLYFCSYFVMVGAEVNEVIVKDREVRAALEGVGL